MRLKRVCEGNSEGNATKTVKLSEVTITREVRSKAEPQPNIVFIEETKHPKAERDDNRLRIISNEPTRYKPKKLDEKILASYPKTRKVIKFVAPGDQFAKGGLTTEAVRLVKMAAKKNVQPEGPASEAYTDAWIAKKISEKYEQMKSTLR